MVRTGAKFDRPAQRTQGSRRIAIDEQQAPEHRRNFGRTGRQSPRPIRQTQGARTLSHAGRRANRHQQAPKLVIFSGFVAYSVVRGFAAVCKTLFGSNMTRTKLHRRHTFTGRQMTWPDRPSRAHRGSGRHPLGCCALQPLGWLKRNSTEGSIGSTTEIGAT